MTSLDLVSAITGVGVSAIYFWVFRRAIRRSMSSGVPGRFALVLGVGLRQLGLAVVLVGLWRAGLAWLWLFGGLVGGVLLHRMLLLRPLPGGVPEGAAGRASEE